MLRIHDILVQIWIRIRRSIPLTNGSGFGSNSRSGSEAWYFHQWVLQDDNLTYYFLKLHSHHFLKIKSHKKSPNSMFFLLFLLDYRMIQNPSRVLPHTNGSGSGSRRSKNMRIQIRLWLCNSAPCIRNIVILFLLKYAFLCSGQDMLHRCQDQCVLYANWPSDEPDCWIPKADEHFNS